MELLLGVFIALSYIAAVIFVRQVTTLFHELGHAIPAMFFNSSEQPVEVFIGSYGDIDGCYTLNFSGLQLFIKPNLLDWKLGMCRHPTTDNLWKEIIITLGGPLASTLIASVFLFHMVQGNWSDGWITLAAICMTSALIDLGVNLYPSEKAITFYDDTIGYSDGYWLKTYISRLSLSDDYFQLEKLFQQSDYAAVVAQGKALIQKSKQKKEVYRLVLSALIQQRDYETAIDFYHDLNDHYKIDEQDHLILSELMLKVNDLDEALNHVNVYLHKNIYDTTALHRRGYIFIKKEEWQEAKFDLENAQRIAPHHPLVNSNLGLLYLKQRDFATAEKYMNFALEVTQEEGLVWFNKGLWFEEKWDWKGALNCYENAKTYGYEYHGLEMKIAEMEGLVVNG